MRPADKKKFKKVGEVDGAAQGFKVVDKVKEGQEYYFRVYAENEVGISEDGAELDSPVKVPTAEKKAVEEEVTAEDAVDAEVQPAKGIPEIVSAPEPVTVTEGETIKLTCKVKGKRFHSYRRPVWVCLAYLFQALKKVWNEYTVESMLAYRFVEI